MEKFHPRSYYIQAFAVAPNGKEMICITSGLSGLGDDPRPTDWNGTHHLLIEGNKLLKKGFESYNHKGPKMFATDGLATIDGNLRWDNDKVFIAPPLKGDKVRARVKLADGKKLESCWDYFPEQPVLKLDGKAVKLPDLPIKIGFSGNVQVVDRVVAIHGDHMKVGSLTADYVDGEFKNWMVHKGECYLTELGLYQLTPMGVSFTELKDLKAPSLELEM